MSGKKQKGFTLLEMLLSIALISSLALISIPIARQFQIRNDVDTAASALAQNLRRAQVLAQAGDEDNTWGAHVAVGSISVFLGPDYAGRDANFDEVFDIPANITVAGLTDVVFAKLSGVPSTTGTFTFTSVGGDVRSVTVNSRGTVSY